MVQQLIWSVIALCIQPFGHGGDLLACVLRIEPFGHGGDLLVCVLCIEPFGHGADLLIMCTAYRAIWAWR